MAGFDDISKKAQQFLGNDKVKDALRSEKAEGISDDLLDKVAGAVDKATGGKYSDKIENAKQQADKHVGNE
ncbi:antitoxin [Curtobacterium sp. RRHDQ10]|uniref:antitoxin n=1 Tax=Curtobacterium phyllosphaerae TaxID=3413379 RepID=UPI003BF08D47